VLDRLLAEPIRMQRMAQNARRMARPHAADAVATMLENLVVK